MGWEGEASLRSNDASGAKIARRRPGEQGPWGAGTAVREAEYHRVGFALPPGFRSTPTNLSTMRFEIQVINLDGADARWS
jgi:hypothetical protein